MPELNEPILSLSFSSVDICELPQVVGQCSGQFPQWYYEAETDSCNLFQYSGCEGNGNRFDSQVQCEQRCKKDMEPEVPAEYEEPYPPAPPVYQPERRPPAPEAETTAATTTTAYPRPEYGEAGNYKTFNFPQKCTDCVQKNSLSLSLSLSVYTISILKNRRPRTHSQ